MVGHRYSKMLMWKVLCHSEIGTSHLQTASPCQDSSQVEVVDTPLGEVLIFVCSDGAGSASHSQYGSEIACEQFLSLAKDFCFNRLNGLSELSVFDAKLWIDSIRNSLKEKAVESELSIRQFACTLLAGIISESESAFFQIGDGAITFADNGEFKAAFWPQSGEYINTTNFITELESSSKLEFGQFGRVNSLAVFSDGLERLMLKFDTRSVHEPALRPMLSMLKNASTDELPQLQIGLAAFLASDTVNRRTDDDKTLILATRAIADDTVL
jgi:hypothetical protein